MTGTDTTCPGVGHPTVRLETAVAIGDHTQMLTITLVNGHLISKKKLLKYFRLIQINEAFDISLLCTQ